MVNWRRWDLTTNALESLTREAAALEPAHRLVTYVLDNEGDGTKRPVPDGVWFLTCADNLGYGGGNNFLAQQAISDHADLDALFVLNNDATVEPGGLGSLLAIQATRPRVGIVGPLVILPSGAVESCGGHFGLKREWWTVYRPGQRTDFVSGAAFLVRKQAWESVGGFDLRYFHYAEDIDLALEITRRGWEVVVTPDARVIHYKSQSPTTAWWLAYYKVRNLVLFWRKHRRLRTVGLNSLFNALRMLLPVRYLIRGQFTEARWAWRGLFDGVRGIKGPLLLPDAKGRRS